MIKPRGKTIQPNNAAGLDSEGRILAAAREEFIERGLRGARMQSIADRGNVNKALLHVLFPLQGKTL